MTWRDRATVAQALQAALAQTVPCEILVSNDASGDGSHEAVLAELEGYAGPHALAVRCNPVNLGVAGHVNAALPLTTRPVVVFMAGDDIAKPQRVERLLQVFDADSRVMAVDSAVEVIDAQGRPHPEPMRQRPGRLTLADFVRAGRLTGLLGAAMALRREVFERFGPLHGPIEDNALSLRAALLGDCLRLPDTLLAYRRHAGSVSAGVFARHEDRQLAMRRRYQRTIAFYRGTADDLEHCLARHDALDAMQRRAAHDLIAMYRIEADAREAILEHPRSAWLGPILRGLAQRGLRRKSAEHALKLLLPRHWFGLRG